MIRIVHFEDDGTQADWTRDFLENAFAEIHYTHFFSASDLFSHLPSFAEYGIDLLITDALLIWHPNQIRPDWALEIGGLRIVDHMRSTPGLENVPVVFWTVYPEDQIDMSKLPSRSIVVSKAHEPAHLVRVIRTLLIATGKTPKMKEKVLDDLSDSIELKPGGFGFSVDLKKAFGAIKKRMTSAQPDACSRRKKPRG